MADAVEQAAMRRWIEARRLAARAEVELLRADPPRPAEALRRADALRAAFPLWLDEAERRENLRFHEIWARVRARAARA